MNFNMTSFKIQLGFVIKPDAGKAYVTRNVPTGDISLPGIVAIFTNLGAEVVDKTHLRFTLTSANYPELVDKGVLASGETLTINITKTKDLPLGLGLGNDFEVKPDGSDIIKVENVTLDKTTHTLTQGEAATFKLNATVSPDIATNKGVNFTSSDESVATVDDNGLVTIKGHGTAIITVTTKDGGKTATCALTVNPAPVTDLEIAPLTKELTLGEAATESFTITATVKPSYAANKAVTFVSNNTSVATVDANGLVTAVSAGTAIITVTSKDNAALSQTSTVTVKAAPITFIDVISIALDHNGQTYAVIEKGETLTLNQTVLPADATNKTLTYVSSATSVATVDANGVITAVGTGTATITATSNNGKTASFDVTVEVSATGIAFLRAETGVPLGGKSTIGALLDGTGVTLTSVKYSTSDTVYITVNETTGEVTGNALTASTPATVTAKYTKADGTELTASYTLNVFTPVDFSNPKSLEGTYDIVDFSTESSALWGAIKVNVGTTKYPGTVKRMIGELSVKVDAVNQTITMISKIQMDSPTLNDQADVGAIKPKEQQFAYSEYKIYNYGSDLATNGKFGDTGSRQQGIVSMNGTKLQISQKFKESIADVNVLTIMTKKTDTPPLLDKTTLYWSKNLDGTNANAITLNLGTKPAVEPHLQLGVF